VSAPTNHWKLGLFVLLGSAAGLLGVLWLGARALRKDTVTYRTYVDEAVSGLQVGSSVTFRGVSIGNVSDIDVAPDRRHVEIRYELGVEELRRLGIANKKGRSVALSMPPDLRAQLSSSGITGSKYLKIDFFDPEKNPPPALPFAHHGNVIPATPSTMKNLEDALTRAVDMVPELAVRLSVVLTRVDNLVARVDEEHLPEKVGAAFAHADEMFTGLHGDLRRAQLDKVAGKAGVTLEQADAALAQMTKVLEHVDGEEGLLKSVQRATDSIGDIASSARGAGGQLDGTLRDMREAATSVRQLMDALEREPDMLFKGRAKVGPQ
jgi:paraquat-inducible protein B